MSVLRWSRETHLKFYKHNQNFVVFLLWLAKQLNGGTKDVWIEYIIPNAVDPCLIPELSFCNVETKEEQDALYNIPWIKKLNTTHQFDLWDGREIIQVTGAVESGHLTMLLLCTDLTLFTPYQKRIPVVLNSGYKFRKVNDEKCSGECPFVIKSNTNLYYFTVAASAATVK